jgi:hypothetical protein
MSLARPHALSPALNTVRAVLVYKSFVDNALSHVGLGVTASCTARALRASGLWADVWGLTSPDALVQRLRAADADALQRGQLPITHVIIHAPWVPTETVAALAAEFPNTVFAVTSHSNFGFLAADPHAVKILREVVELQETTQNVVVAGNSKRFVAAASDMWGVPVVWLPNLYQVASATPAPRPPWPGDSLRLGLFGAARILKNGLTAAAAAVILAERLRVPTELYVSTGTEEEGTNRALTELTDNVPNLTLERAGWLSWTTFRSLVANMHVLLQPSFTESFNVVTADGIAEGVPTVVSPAIDWVPSTWQADPDDAGDVARVAEYLLKSPKAVDDGRAALASYVTTGLAAWTSFVVAAA